MLLLSAQRILLFVVFALGTFLILLPGWYYRFSQKSLVLQHRFFSHPWLRVYLQNAMEDLQNNKHVYLLMYRGLGLLFLILLLINNSVK